ncbi:hypothetical protein SNEBB_009266 [Seison nebaliae]|nr:hypothetical protein SNEBB_009266 [Seison nebaliae]
MRAVVQKVRRASVSIGGRVHSSIDNGLVLLLGIHRDDTMTDMEYIVRKCLNIRLFEGEMLENGRSKMWSKNVKDVNGKLLIISQFTLCHQLKGNKPDFHLAMSTTEAKELFEKTIIQFQKNYSVSAIETGVFGEMMEIDLVNDGPVTIVIDSNDNKK